MSFAALMAGFRATAAASAALEAAAEDAEEEEKYEEAEKKRKTLLEDSLEPPRKYKKTVFAKDPSAAKPTIDNGQVMHNNQEEEEEDIVRDKSDGKEDIVGGDSEDQGEDSSDNGQGMNDEQEDTDAAAKEKQRKPRKPKESLLNKMQSPEERAEDKEHGVEDIGPQIAHLIGLKTTAEFLAALQAITPDVRNGEMLGKKLDTTTGKPVEDPEATALRQLAAGMFDGGGLFQMYVAKDRRKSVIIRAEIKMTIRTREPESHPRASSRKRINEPDKKTTITTPIHIKRIPPLEFALLRWLYGGSIRNEPTAKSYHGSTAMHYSWYVYLSDPEHRFLRDLRTFAAYRREDAEHISDYLATSERNDRMAIRDKVHRRYTGYSGNPTPMRPFDPKNPPPRGSVWPPQDVFVPRVQSPAYLAGFFTRCGQVCLSRRKEECLLTVTLRHPNDTLLKDICKAYGFPMRGVAEGRHEKGVATSPCQRSYLRDDKKLHMDSMEAAKWSFKTTKLHIATIEAAQRFFAATTPYLFGEQVVLRDTGDWLLLHQTSGCQLGNEHFWFKRLTAKYPEENPNRIKELVGKVQEHLALIRQLSTVCRW